MSRYTIVYPADGSPSYIKGSRSENEPVRGVAILPDQPDFISPIDGKLYRGRAGMREHNKIHDVVSNRDLVGLPTLTANSDVRSEAEKSASAESRKKLIVQGVYKHVYGVD